MKLDDLYVCIKCRKAMTWKSRKRYGQIDHCCEPGVVTVYRMGTFTGVMDALILRFGQQLHHERGRAAEAERLALNGVTRHKSQEG